MKTTRKEKRLLEDNCNLFKEVLQIINHFLPNVFNILNALDDPRHQSYIKYKQSDLLFVRLLGYMCHFNSMNQMNEEFNNENVITNLQIVCGKHIEEVPHGDTINKYLKEVDIDNMRSILHYIVKSLINKKMVEDYRINNKYYHLVIDGVCLFNYPKQHVKNCLVRKYESGLYNYHTDILVGIITMGNIMIPVDFEIIENEEMNSSKQDCESNAAKRMLARIKRNYKRLPICFSGDGLYLSEPILEVCKENRWKYIITYKEGCASTIEEYYQVSKKYNDINTYSRQIEEKTKQKYEYYNGIEYRKHSVNMMKLEETKGTTKTNFCYVTNIKITKNNIIAMMSYGRQRWKIENKSFNDMKNHGYHVGHAFSYDSNAIQGHFLLLMVALLLMQLVEYGERVKKRFTSIRKIGTQIKEALRNTVLSANEIREVFKQQQFRRPISY